MTRQFFQTVSMAAAITLGASAAIGSFSQPSYANTFPGMTFECSGPKLTARTTMPPKTVDLINFTPAGGFSAADRCLAAKRNFNDANADPAPLMKANLAYITTGLQNGQTILCSVPKYGDPCDTGGSSYLFTLSNKIVNNPQEALRRLFFRLHTGNDTKPVLQDSESRIYIDMKEYIRAAFAEEGGSAESSQR
jgi:hypothetical protein